MDLEDRPAMIQMQSRVYISSFSGEKVNNPEDQLKMLYTNKWEGKEARELAYVATLTK